MRSVLRGIDVVDQGWPITLLVSSSAVHALQTDIGHVSAALLTHS